MQGITGFTVTAANFMGMAVNPAGTALNLAGVALRFVGAALKFARMAVTFKGMAIKVTERLESLPKDVSEYFGYLNKLEAYDKLD